MYLLVDSYINFGFPLQESCDIRADHKVALTEEKSPLWLTESSWGVQLFSSLLYMLKASETPTTIP